MEENIPLIKITSEEEAFETLKRALANEIPDNAQIEFEGWPTFKLSIYGDGFEGTIPTRIMPPIIELQQEIHRVYCRAKYGDDNLRRLTDTERDHLELVVEVREGCTEFIAEVGKALNEVIQNSDMSGTEAALAIVSIAALITGGYMWKTWVGSRERIHGMEQQTKLSEQETQRLEIVTQAMNDNAQVIAAKEGFDNVKASFAKKLKPSDEIKLEDQVILHGEQAEVIVKTPREEPRAVRIDGDFVISDISFPSEFGQPYKLHVKRVNDGMKLTVEASHDAISKEQIETIKNAGFGIKVVSLQINAQQKRDVMSKAKLYSITIANNA